MNVSSLCTSRSAWTQQSACWPTLNWPASSLTITASLQEPVRGDGAPQRTLGGDAGRVRGHLQGSDAELLKVVLPGGLVGKRLLDRMGQRITDRRVLDLVRRMLKSAVVMPDGTRIAVEEGAPQGGPLSPLLSNIVLDEFDRELARRGLRFVRYADDANVFVRSERAGTRVMASLGRFLEHRLRLQINQEKSAVRRPEQVHFLGFRFLCHDGAPLNTGITLSDKAKRAVMSTIRELTPPNWGRSVTSCMAGLSRYLNGWMAHYRLCTSEVVPELGVIDAHIRRRLRAIIVPQKKRPRFLHRHLLARKVSRKAAAGTAYCGKGSWPKSNRPGMTKAYPPAWFRERMVSLKTRWSELSTPRATDQLRWHSDDRPKEPDAGPHVRFCERRGGVIHHAYSTPTGVMPRQRRRNSGCREQWQVIEVGAIRRSGSEARMWPRAIVEIQVPAERSTGIADTVVGPQVDLLVFDRPPQPLNKDIVAPRAAAIHADRDGIVQQQAGERGAGELTALIGVEDLRPAAPGQRLLDRLKAERHLQGDRQPPRQDPPAEPVHHSSQIDEAPRHRNVGDVHCPYLVRPLHREAA